MADLEQKGKISMEPKVLMMTSNLFMKALADKYSLDVMSIIRRAEMHIEQSVRPEFCKDGTKMLDSAKVKKAFGNDAYPDVWLFEVRHAVNADSKVELRHSLPEKSDLRAVVTLLSSMSQSHFANQKFVVENSFNLAGKLEVCHLCHSPAEFCTCQQAIISIDTVRESALAFALNRTPDFIFQNSVYQIILSLLNRSELWNKMKEKKYFYAIMLLCSTYISSINSSVGILFMLLTSYLFMGSCWNVHRNYIHHIAMQRGNMTSIVEKIKQYKIQYILGSCALLAIFYKTMKYFFNLYKLTHQGNLMPTTPEEIDARDKEQNPWIGAYVTPVPQLSRVLGSYDQTLSLTAKNICYMRLPHHPKGVACCDAMFIKSNLAIVPDHMWYSDTMEAEFFHSRALNNNTKEMEPVLRSRSILSKETSYLVPGTDFRVVYVPACSAWRDLTPHLPDGNLTVCKAALVYRGKDGDIKNFDAGVTYTPSITVGEKTFEGYKYTLKESTFQGMCMSALVTDTKPSVIAGFHLGGRLNVGVAGILTKAHIADAEKYLSAMPSVLVSHSMGTMPTQQFDKQVFIGPEIHRSSCLNYLGNDNSLTIYGSTIGRSTYRSSVIETPISPLVEKHCGIPQLWGAPKFHPWKPFYEGIKKTSSPSVGVSPVDLAWAVDDFSKPLMNLIQTPYWKEDVKPLTPMQVLCGIDGKRFVDKMPSNTSIGFPLTGPKKNYMTALPPSDHPDFNCPMDIEPRFWEEVERISQVYLRGERAYPIFKAALKDEVTKLTKDKVRVFFGAPFPLQALVRKYFLPVCRFLSMNPVLAECAVGINAQGPEWDQLARHMRSNGADRIFAGDYSSYDTRMPAQLGLASWKIFISLAKATGNYTPDDIKIMEGVATDCCYPVVAYNGDLVEFAGVHISGINLTAYIGCIDNSLLQRSGYHNMGFRRCITLLPYRDVVAIFNYGDDFKGSVSAVVPWFNHISYKEYLAEYGIILTMPDKTSTPTKYMKDEEADFLKRHNVYNKETGLFIGALDKASIYKSLHAVLASKEVNPTQQSAMNIDGALREMFAHGEDAYEKFRSKMQLISDDANLDVLCLMLNETYQDRVDHFRERYLGEEKKSSRAFCSKDETFECQSGWELSSSELTKQLEATINPTSLVGRQLTLKEENFYVSEEELIRRVKKDFGMNPVMENAILGYCSLGEIDLAFDIGTQTMIIIELKSPINEKAANRLCNKARKQLIKYVSAFSILIPNCNFVGFIYTQSRGYEFVSASKLEFDKKVVKRFPFLPFPI
jgi:hypothetical protein